MHAKTSFSRWKQTKNSWKTSSQETSHGSFNMVRKQNNRVISGSVSLPRPKKTRMQCSQVKVMLITFFDHQEMVYHEFVPQGQTVNQHFYKEVLTRQQNSSKTKSFLGRKNLALASRQCSCLHSPQHETVLGLKRNHHVASSTLFARLSPCDFFLFLKLKGILKGARYQEVEDIKTSVTRHFKTITKKEFSQCFNAWSKRMEKCNKAYEKYFEGDK